LFSRFPGFYACTTFFALLSQEFFVRDPKLQFEALATHSAHASGLDRERFRRLFEPAVLLNVWQPFLSRQKVLPDELHKIGLLEIEWVIRVRGAL
jgi:hypothetical protein